MAPTDRKMTSNKSTAKESKRTKDNVQAVKKKKKWFPKEKFEGSVQEGQGFAFKRKQKVRHEYNKLLQKQRKNPMSKPPYTEEYPEHLRHLYVAEAKKLKEEAWTNRINRTKMRMKGWARAEETTENNAVAEQHTEAVDPDPEVSSRSEQTDSVTGKSDSTASPEKESLPVSNRMRKKMQKKTSYQRTKEEFEAAKEERKRRKKKEEFLKNKQQKEEAIQKYKQKKMETFQMLSKKTKKGQPNLNLQMEYLLQKIQATKNDS